MALLCVCITWKTSRQTTHRKLYVCLSPGKKIKIKIKFSISTQKSHFLKIIGQKYTPPIETTPDKTHVLRKLCVCRRKKKKHLFFRLPLPAGKNNACFSMCGKTWCQRQTHTRTHTHARRQMVFVFYVCTTWNANSQLTEPCVSPGRKCSFSLSEKSPSKAFHQPAKITLPKKAQMRGKENTETACVHVCVVQTASVSLRGSVSWQGWYMGCFHK